MASNWFSIKSGTGPERRVGWANVFLPRRLLLLCSLVSASWMNETAQAAGQNGEVVPIAGLSSVFHRAILDAFPEARTRNMACAPLGMWRLFRLLEAGADGSTLEEMKMVLDAEEVNLDIPSPSSYMRGPSLTIRPVERLIANPAFFSDRTFNQYCGDMEERYHATVELLDFGDTPARAAAAINRFVAEVTSNAITQVVSQLDFSPDTKLAAISAMFFKAAWRHPFLPVGRGAFNAILPGGASVLKFCDFMRNDFPELAVEYIDGPVKAIRLPYTQTEFAMYIFMPKDIQVFEANADFEILLDDLVDQMHLGLSVRRQRPEKHQGNVHVLLPRFSLSADENSFDASRVLQVMGIHELFNRPNLSRMTENPRAYVDMFKQAVQLNVNEQHTVAAAGTAADVPTRGSSGTQITRFLHFTEPFVFQVRHQPNYENPGPWWATTDLVLFSGHVMDCETD
ncbi:m151r [Cystoisospora suis]|uniref:M151r n=1 Tax=Cystoisospora suis TaxID=483139 RepID=A0A2C6KUN5_9APIC|nr:m151r [Cystoisospora suis]